MWNKGNEIEEKKKIKCTFSVEKLILSSSFIFSKKCNLYIIHICASQSNKLIYRIEYFVHTFTYIDINSFML